ncbi:hypothetical protein EDD11_002124 [Mortierella claussenii]|nr:hypothetical protein EDD11_002124 [Mortierella claussenii]
MEKRDALNTTDDHSNDITPETIDHLLDLAHLYKPKDSQELKRLERDVRRMRNFLNYIRSTDHQHSSTASVESLRSLVDDGEGLRLRPSVASATESNEGMFDEESKENQPLDKRSILLKRPKVVKGNFFVVETGRSSKDT